MERWEQVFDHMEAIEKGGGHPVGQQFRRRPDVVGHPGGHGGRDRAPAPGGAAPAGRLGQEEVLGQTLVWEDQVLGGQRQPELLLQPGQLLAEPSRLTEPGPGGRVVSYAPLFQPRAHEGGAPAEDSGYPRRPP